MVTVVGTDIPTGDEVNWYIGGAEATLIQESLVESSGVITLSKKAEFGSVFVVDSSEDPTTSMLELTSLVPDTDASEALGTSYVRTSAAGSATVTAYYVDIETTALVHVIACKDISTNLSIDTKELELAGQIQKLRKTGAITRTASLEEVDYNDVLIGAILGDYISDSPLTGDKKWIDNFTGTKKISCLVGKQYQSGVLIKKWFLMGCQVSKIDGAFPAADFYTKSMDFLVDYMLSTTLVPNA